MNAWKRRRLETDEENDAAHKNEGELEASNITLLVSLYFL